MSGNPIYKSDIVSSYRFERPVGRDSLVDAMAEGETPPWETTILVGELHHRLQNMLSIVMALSRLTARDVSTMDEFQAAFCNRIEAMARTNALLLRGQVQVVSVKAALEAELQAYLDESGQVTITCDPIKVSSVAALSLSLIFHELATNAVKYGALSVDGGRLIVECRRGELNAIMFWREHMTKTVSTLFRKGSGWLLIDRLTRGLGGTSRIDIRPEGLQAEISFKCA